MATLTQGWPGAALVLVFGIAFHVAMIVTFRAFAKKSPLRLRYAAVTLALMALFLGMFFVRAWGPAV